MKTLAQYDFCPTKPIFKILIFLFLFIKISSSEAVEINKMSIYSIKDNFNCNWNVTVEPYYMITELDVYCNQPLGLDDKCYLWILKEYGGPTIQSAVTYDDQYTFTDLAPGNYSMEVHYLEIDENNDLVGHKDTIDKIFINKEYVNCYDVDLFHNTPLPFVTSREGTLTANCDISNNRTTVFQASELIKLQPGFKSGTGIFTNFRAYIAPCPGSGKKGNDEGNDYITETISEGEPEEDEKDEIEESTNFHIYPNPSNGEFQLTIDSKELAKVYIYDIFGRLIEQLTMGNDQLTIDISKHPKGIYLVKVLSGEKVYIKKLIHQ